MLKIAGYVRVSTDEQADSGAGLQAQRAALEQAAELRGWNLVDIYADRGASGKTLHDRPGLEQALAAVSSGYADGLAVAKLDRLSRSLLDFASLMERSQREGWSLVALDLAVDTSTPSGELMANVLAVFAQFERKLIGQRTRDALAARRAAGVRLGRPSVVPAEVRSRIVMEREWGSPYAEIADRLNLDGVPTVRGGRRWYPATVRQVALGAAS